MNRQLSADLAEVLDSQLAPNTVKAYACAWRKWEVWCAKTRIQTLPATSDDFLRFLLASRRKLRRPTLTAVANAVSRRHLAAGVESPVGKMAWRVLGQIPHEARPKSALVMADIRQLVAQVNRTTLRGKRDVAVILIGFAGAMRQSEICAARIEWLRAAKHGLDLVFPPASAGKGWVGTKTGKVKGDVVGIPRWKDHTLCPVHALQAWLKASGHKRGPIFRPVARGKSIDRQLEPQMVATLVKRLSREAGLKGDYAGHSLRAGFVTEAVGRGVGPLQVAATTRHKSLAMVQRYYRPSDVLLGGAGLLIDPG